MTAHSLTLSSHEVRAALREELSLVVRPVVSVVGIGRVTEFGPSDTKGYDWIMRDRRMLWNDLRHDDLLQRCPLGGPGDRLVCKETWAHDAPSLTECRWRYEDIMGGLPGYGPYYQADPVHENAGLRWRSPATMPAWASRITLEVVGVRCMRVQDLTDADALVCGFDTMNGNALNEGWGGNDEDSYSQHGWDDPRMVLADFWISRYGRRYPWESNPWAWAAKVKRVEGNV